MLQRVLIIPLSVLLASALLFAHGNAPHVTGTVTAIDTKANSITVKDGKQNVVVMLNKSTLYMKDKKAASAADLKVGLRVVIDVKVDEKTKTYTGTEVTMGVMDPAFAKAK